jgi:hypothetical protein
LIAIQLQNLDRIERTKHTGKLIPNEMKVGRWASDDFSIIKSKTDFLRFDVSNLTIKRQHQRVANESELMK